MLERSIEDYRKLTEDYCLKNVFSDIYRQYDKESALEVFWYHDAQALGTQALKIVQKHIFTLDGILVWYVKSINNGFVEVVNNIQTYVGWSEGSETQLLHHYNLPLQRRA